MSDCDSSSSYIASFILFILSVYIITLSPSISGGDTGELLAEGCHLGIAHPPGYPLYTLLVHLLYNASILSKGEFEVAYLMNISSALFTSLAAGFIGYTMHELEISISGIIFSMGMFSFSSLLWQYAVTSEVFPLNSFFASLLIYLTILYIKYKDFKYVYFGAFISGLALCNQHTIILYEIPLILIVAIVANKDMFFNLRRMILILFLFVIGIAPYAYLPIAAIYFPKAGSWGNVTNMQGFLHHFLRKDYGSFQLYSGRVNDNLSLYENLTHRTLLYLHDLGNVQGYFYIIPIFSIIGVLFGCYRLYNHKISQQLILVIPFLFYIIVFHSLSNMPLDDKLLYGVHQRFWMQLNIISFLFAGIGLDILLRMFQKANWIKYSVVTILVLYQLHCNFLLSNQRNAMYFSNYSKAILHPLPENSILIINYDMQWTSIRYQQVCMDIRKDVKVINLSMMTYQWFSHQLKQYSSIKFPGKFYSSHNNVKDGFTLKQFIDLNKKSHRVFISGKINYPDGLLREKYEFMPYGLVSEFIAKEKLPKVEKYLELVHMSWKGIGDILPIRQLPHLQKYTEFTWEWTIFRDYVDRLSG